MVKFLHVADVHLDAPMNELPSRISNARKLQIEEAFVNMLEKAAEDGTDIVLMAGDIFDSPSPRASTADYIRKFAREYSHIRIFFSPGNHDCLLNNSYYDILSREENIHVFTEEKVSKISLDDLGCDIYGIGSIQPHSEKKFLNGFFVDDTSRINILCCHGLIQGEQGHVPYNPLSKTDIAQSGFDYIALGHVHTYTGVHRLGNVCYAYSGAFASHGYDEIGQKGYIEGTVEKNGISYSFSESGVPSFVKINVDCTGAENILDVISKVKKECTNYPEGSIARIILSGEVRDGLVINRSSVLKCADRFVYTDVKDFTVPEKDYLKLSKEQTLKGLFVRKVLESGKDEATIQRAIAVGLAALSGEEMNTDDY